jgi:hypothetical protein
MTFFLHYRKLLAQSRARHGQALLQLMDEQRKGPLPTFIPVDDRRIYGPTYSPYRTSSQLPY